MMVIHQVKVLVMPLNAQSIPLKTGVIYIVDDDEDARESLVWLLESNGFKVSPHESAERFLLALQNADPAIPACLLLDHRLPGMSGLELYAQLIKQRYLLPAAFITGYADVALAVQAIKQGAQDFIEKPYKEDLICKLANEMLDKAYSDYQKHMELNSIRNKLKTLTKREREVLECLTAGCTNKQVGQNLHISLKTVEAHRANVMDKLGVNRAATLLKLSITNQQYH